MLPIPKSNAKDIKIAISHQQLVYGVELASGSFGTVYKGTHLYMDVAIKKLKQKNFDNNSLTEFNREVNVMVNLRSLYLVQLYGACFESPNYAIVMEYMAGGTLFNLLHDQNTILEWDIRYRYGLDIAKGMAYLHSRNIAHCDLKSLNVLLDATKLNVKIADFGLSKMKATASSLFSTANGGSTAWKAPELGGISAINYDNSADVYSFAMVLWEIAARKEPYQGKNPDGLLTWVSQSEENRETIPEKPHPQ